MPLNIAVVTSQLCSTEQKNQIPILVDLSRLSIRNPDSASTGGNQKWLNIKICDISSINTEFKISNSYRFQCLQSCRKLSITIQSFELKARRSSNIRIEVVLIETGLVFDSRWLLWKKHSGPKLASVLRKKNSPPTFFQLRKKSESLVEGPGVMKIEI